MLTLPASDRSPRVLLVDDDAHTRAMLAGFLRAAGCTIDEAADGREALARALSARPHVVITESRLPGISGFELCRLLRADAETRTIPVLFVTGADDARSIDLAREAGVNAVLSKPCSLELLETAIRNHLAAVDGTHPGDTAAPGAEGANLMAASASASHPPRQTLARAHQRGDTTHPSTLPPILVCPSCDRSLIYVRSFVGGVNVRHPEQWDYFERPNGCGTYQYRQRTRKIRRVT